MARLIYPYEPLFPGGLLRPMADAVAINTLNGRETEFTGIFDTGADYVSLSPALLGELSINPDDLPDEVTETPSGVGQTKMCDFLLIGVEHNGKLYFPNDNSPVPLIFSRGSTNNLLGQTKFLHHCIATFNGPGRFLSLEF